MNQFSPSPVALHLLTARPPARRRRVPRRASSTDALLRRADDS